MDEKDLLPQRVSAQSGQWYALAPGRINLIGEHTDYNSGFALPLAIDRYTRIAAQRSESSGDLEITSRVLSETVRYSLDGQTCLSHQRTPQWAKYVAGVIDEFGKLGFRFPPLKFTIESGVPIGAGVSSSASLEVAMAMALQQISGARLSGLEIAQLCQRAEHQHAGVPCGLMDQLASVFGVAGSLMLLDCRSNQVEYVPLSADLALVVIDSRVKHNLANGEYRLRREQCEAACAMLNVTALRDVTWDHLNAFQSQMPALIFRRARHVVTENQRTQEMAGKIQAGHWLEAGALMYDSHDSMRNDFEITTSEIDCLVEIAQAIGAKGGVFGARMTGGGFGGCVICLAASDRAPLILKAVQDQYHARTGNSVAGFVTFPAPGALALNPKF
jgi:galactokinase